jgi:hypothetical protein
MALVGHARSGKTRGIIEVSKLVEAQGVPVLYISLNGEYTTTETSNPVDSVLARIAYAALQPAVKGIKPLHNTSGKLQFTCSMDTIVEWLGETKCVLAIDELNKFITPGHELVIRTLPRSLIGLQALQDELIGEHIQAQRVTLTLVHTVSTPSQ